MFTRSGLHAYILTQSRNHARLVPVKLREIVRYKKVKSCYCNQVPKDAESRRGKKKGKKRKKKGKKKTKLLSVHDYSHTLTTSTESEGCRWLTVLLTTTDYYEVQYFFGLQLQAAAACRRRLLDLIQESRGATWSISTQYSAAFSNHRQ